MRPTLSTPLVHLELHTRDAQAALAFYGGLCGWPSERVDVAAGSYLALEPGGGITGGMVECETPHSLWLPYVAVESVDRATERASELGATVMLDKREGPAGWRSVVSTPAGGELAFWQQKR
jgi:predicted enzyme related to lactoylglutathione lyase